MKRCSSGIGLVLLVLLSTSTVVFAFAPSNIMATKPSSTSLRLPNSSRQRRHDVVPLQMARDPTNRRNVLSTVAGGMLGLASMTASPSPALPKEKKPKEPKTPETVQAAFSSLEFELRDPKGGIQIMQEYIDEKDFTGLLEFTKTYDQLVRKQKWARCKAFMNNAEQEVATLQGNAVTFDLIGINRASRQGQESVERANKYLQELRVDLQAMVDMQQKVQFEGDGSFEDYYQSIQGK